MKQTRMAQTEYVEMYCWGAKLTLSEFDRQWIAMECDCGDIKCRGWAIVPNNPAARQTHRRLYVRRV